VLTLKTKQTRILVWLLVACASAIGTLVKGTVSKPGREQDLAAHLQTAQHEMTVADIDSFLDGVIPLQLRRENIVGAVVVIVQDGKIIFSKGYGYADNEGKQPVSPDLTLFRTASVSKLFTWTAVMQLVEQGRLNLDHDVNEYIDFKIPATFPAPITLRNIMTHTAGFEESEKGIFVRDARELAPLGVYLRERLPRRIFPPGVTPAYSNYAATLAGYIVQRASGELYEEYIENHILKPLGMTHTTFRQPLPKALQPLMSQAYSSASEPAQPFELFQAQPAGGESATGTDMGKFMIAQLQQGEFEQTRILQAETARLMHSAQFKSLPQMNAMALGFWEDSRNGHRIIGHGGDTMYFHSGLYLMLDANVGLFISQNSEGTGTLRSRVWEAFLDRYFPYTPPSSGLPPTYVQDAALVSGNYLSTRRAESNVRSIEYLSEELKVFVNSDRSISVNEYVDLNGKPKHFRETEPLLFREIDGQSRVGFKRDISGRIILVRDNPSIVFQKTHWYQNWALNLIISMGVIVVWVFVTLWWPLEAFLRWRRSDELDDNLWDRRLRIIVRVTCLAELMTLGAWMWIQLGVKDPRSFSDGMDPVLRLIQLTACVGLAGAPFVVYTASKVWTVSNTVWRKLSVSTTALACCGFVWILFNWHLLAWSLNY
jgi:CubicO group peptidase (beta-lactamase class C family)